MEVIHCETLKEAILVYEQSVILGTPFMVSMWPEFNCFNVASAGHGNFEYYNGQPKKYKIITPEEWLNRYNVFILGQKVLVRDTTRQNWETKIFLHDSTCVSAYYETQYRGGDNYRTYSWNYIKGPKDSKVEIIINGEVGYISKELAQEIQGLLI